MHSVNSFPYLKKYNLIPLNISEMIYLPSHVFFTIPANLNKTCFYHSHSKSCTLKQIKIKNWFIKVHSGQIVAIDFMEKQSNLGIA